MRAFKSIFWLLAALLAVQPAAGADDKAAREAAARVQRMVSKLQQEKSALEREKNETGAKLEAMTKESGALKSDASKSRRQAAALEKELAQMRGENADMKAKLEQLNKSLADTSQQCQDAAVTAEEGRKRSSTIAANLKTNLEKEESERKSCQANNLKLRTLAHEILDRYQKKGVFEGLLQAEPFTQIKTVEIENFVQDSGDKIDDLKAEHPNR